MDSTSSGTSKSGEAPIVHLSDSASLKGKLTYLEGNPKPVYTYLGVPFAEPPVGDLRMKKPVSKSLWNGQRDATKDGLAPIQDIPAYLSLHDQMGSKQIGLTGEDCLCLNVYTPSESGKGSLPVMVWLYGGAFQIGAISVYPGTAMAALHDVVFVAINYRVGILGFFSTGNDTCNGNFGLWDQLEGLKWVQKHIGKLGGDPNNVTIFGESAGGVCCSLHHLMSESKDLFHKSIQMSGVGGMMGPLFTPEVCKDKCSQIAKILEMPEDTTPEKIHEVLMTLSTDDIIKKLGPAYYMPSIDGELFTDNHYPTLVRNEFPRTQTIFTVNSHEGAMFLNNMYKPMNLPLKTKENFLAFLNVMLGIQVTYAFKDKEGMAKAIQEEYLSQENPTETDILQAVVDTIGEIWFFAPINNFARVHSDAVPDGVYYGVFNYRNSRSVHEPFVTSDHTDDVPMAFGIPLLMKEDRGPFEWTEEDVHMSKIMMQYYATFAKSGNPNGSSLPEWPKFTSSKPTHLCLQAEPSPVFKHYKPSRADFWATVPQKYQ